MQKVIICNIKVGSYTKTNLQLLTIINVCYLKDSYFLHSKEKILQSIDLAISQVLHLCLVFSLGIKQTNFILKDFTLNVLYANFFLQTIANNIIFILINMLS